MQAIEVRGLEQLDSSIKKILRGNQAMKRELHEDIAKMAQLQVQIEVGMTLDDFNGHVKSWQDKHVGSRGGYAAVRPVGGVSGPNSPGAITNYLNSGHKIRRPAGLSKRYKNRARMAYVRGRHFYESAIKPIESEATYIVEEFAQRIVEELGK